MWPKLNLVAALLWLVVTVRCAPNNIYGPQYRNLLDNLKVAFGKIDKNGFDEDTEHRPDLDAAYVNSTAASAGDEDAIAEAIAAAIASEADAHALMDDQGGSNDLMVDDYDRKDADDASTAVVNATQTYAVIREEVSAEAVLAEPAAAAASNRHKEATSPVVRESAGNGVLAEERAQTPSAGDDAAMQSSKATVTVVAATLGSLVVVLGVVNCCYLALTARKQKKKTANAGNTGILPSRQTSA